MRIYLTSILITTIILFFLSCDKKDSNSSFLMFGNNFQDIESNEKYKDYEENPFLESKKQPVSTFSVDADGASYSNMRRYLNLGQLPPKGSVRIEEFLNYFTFDYQAPIDDENMSINAEMATCPWNDKNHIIRLGIKGKNIDKTELPNSNYVFLIDVSGSMNSPDKLGILKAGFITLVDNLKDGDKIAIVTYAGSSNVLLNSTFATEKKKIKDAINALNAGGSTSGAEGIKTAYEIAQKNLIQHGNNRIIIGSDGDFNVGPSSSEELIKLIETQRDKGIYLTVLGVGQGNLNDHAMEQIANNGNGNYEYIDNAKQIQKVFVEELNKFYTIAKDTKIQIKFNPNKISSYRLIGYENRSLNIEDFEDNTKDAGEIGAGQTITAIYEVVLEDKNLNEQFAQFDVRYKKPNSENSIFIQHNITNNPKNIRDASENMKFAAAVTGFGLLLKDSKYKGNINKTTITTLANDAVSFDPGGYRKEFLKLVQNMQK